MRSIFTWYFRASPDVDISERGSRCETNGSLRRFSEFVSQIQVPHTNFAPPSRGGADQNHQQGAPSIRGVTTRFGARIIEPRHERELTQHSASSSLSPRSPPFGPRSVVPSHTLLRHQSRFHLGRRDYSRSPHEKTNTEHGSRPTKPEHRAFRSTDRTNSHFSRHTFRRENAVRQCSWHQARRRNDEFNALGQCEARRGQRLEHRMAS